MAREKGKVQESIITIQVPLMGTKRGNKLEEFEMLEDRPHKRVCDTNLSSDTQYDEILAVAARQHCWEQ